MVYYIWVMKNGNESSTKGINIAPWVMACGAFSFARREGGGVAGKGMGDTLHFGAFHISSHSP